MYKPYNCQSETSSLSFFYQVSPLEIETVILQHPGVLNVAVTGFSDPICGDLPVAVVIPRDNVIITPQEIKDLVRSTY